MTGLALIKSHTSRNREESDWAVITLDEKIDFLTLRKLEIDGHRIGGPEFQRLFPTYRHLFDSKTDGEVEEIFSTVEPFSTPQEISDYVWQGKRAAKWAAYGRILQPDQRQTIGSGKPRSILGRFLQRLKR